jgi:arylsulfatase
MKTKIVRTLVLAGLTSASALGQSKDGLDRTVLPIREPQYPAITELDARDAKASPRFEIKAPAAAPNVVIVLLDDIGFGQSGAFGGPCRMPTLDRLAANGLKYNTFHTCALCSPTRTALLTGRNHHVNNAGAIMELATAFPGNTGIRPNSVAPLAEMLRLNGYSTAAFGKYHETPPWEVSVSGPYDRWPTHSGFDKFYGFIGGETNQWAPAIDRRELAGAGSLHPSHTGDNGENGMSLDPCGIIDGQGLALIFIYSRLRYRHYPN